MTMTKESITDILTAMGVSLEATFIPWSQSRNKNEKRKSLNWIVILKREGKKAISTDYMQGIGHIPGFPIQARMTSDLENLLSLTVEQGKVYNYKRGNPMFPMSTKKLDPPSVLDVLHCLLMDSDVLNYATFEEWANELGYDPDSRKAEGIYQECLQIALQVKQMFSAGELEELYEMVQDY